MDTFLWISSGLLLAYLALGLGLFLPLRGALTNLDQRSAGNGLPQHLLMLPGLLFLWPALLGRWYRATRNVPSATHRRSPQARAMRCLGIAAPLVATLLLLGIVPAGIFSSPRVMNEADNARSMTNSPFLPRRRVSFGSPFPSLPAEISLGKGLGNFGLRFDFPEGISAPPALLYWSPTLDAYGAPAGEVLLLGIVGGTQSTWIALPNAEMRYQGYLSIYACHNGRTESYGMGADRRVKIE